MNITKDKILHIIYEQFQNWQADLTIACKKGCATCCTTNVMITAIEGEVIHRFIREQGKEEWFARQLNKNQNTSNAPVTTNGYARSCLNGENIDLPDNTASTCPFLADDNSCNIYEARPFSCRCFVSMEKCQPGHSAVVPEYFLSGATATLQIIEHLGQKEYWGYLTDVLLALCDIRENSGVNKLLENQSLSRSARARVRSGEPLPGFLFTVEEDEKIRPLLDSIFKQRINRKSVEEILNGQ